MPAEGKGPPQEPRSRDLLDQTGLLLLILVVVSGLTMVLSANLDPGVGKNLGHRARHRHTGLGHRRLRPDPHHRDRHPAGHAHATHRREPTGVRDLADEYRSMNREFFPTHVFEPTAEPDPAFNRLMMQDLQNTRQYLFRGFSGRHAAARLLLSRSEWEFRAVVADPGDLPGSAAVPVTSIRHSAADVDVDTILARLHEEIRMGLVGLYLARSRCSRMEVTVISDPPLDRLEMFDDSVWVTLYSDAARARRVPAHTAVLGGLVHLQHGTRRVRPDQRVPPRPPPGDHPGHARGRSSSRSSRRSPTPR